MHGNVKHCTCTYYCYAVLSRASAHTQASAHPPILAVSVVWVVLRVTAHHAICGIA